MAAYAAAIAHAHEPARHNTLCTAAALANVSSSSKDLEEGRRFVIPLAHAAKAHANVNPYAGADLAIVNPTPNAAATNADE